MPAAMAKLRTDDWDHLDIPPLHKSVLVCVLRSYATPTPGARATRLLPLSHRPGRTGPATGGSGFATAQHLLELASCRQDATRRWQSSSASAGKFQPCSTKAPIFRS